MYKDETEVYMYMRSVHYHETDQMGLAHHANYVKWLEEARIDFMAQLGLNYALMEKEGLYLPVLGIQCRYHKPFHFAETVVIDTRLIEYSGVRFSMGYRLYVAGSAECHTTAESDHCFMDRVGRPVALKRFNPTYHDLFEKTLQIKMIRGDV